MVSLSPASIAIGLRVVSPKLLVVAYAAKPTPNIVAELSKQGIILPTGKNASENRISTLKVSAEFFL